MDEMLVELRLHLGLSVQKLIQRVLFRGHSDCFYFIIMNKAILYISE